MHVCFQAIVRFLREKKHLIPIHMVKTMSYEVSHLGFQIEKKTTNLLEGNIIYIPTKQQFHHQCGFKEEDS
jgi:hypothetical protein